MDAPVIFNQGKGCSKMKTPKTWCQVFGISYLLSFPNYFALLKKNIYFRKTGKEKGRETRWLPLTPQLGPWPVTQECALLGIEPAVFTSAGWHPVLQTGVPLATLSVLILCFRVIFYIHLYLSQDLSGFAYPSVSKTS
ncbi:hypothetical protein HJG60_010142 [Phyllostomus discolor]|uniref:Uncharacterized protein n=1 Tax=Phyllostomus discolor TaxID=89673 RepID=A0A834AW25_9CHIR|nr:hypothetical protein HJG60_010142 [Phyllostomus discolor]